MPHLEKISTTRSAKGQRQPQQSRGEHRVDAILNACERILVSEGESALGMHRIAADAQTSIGSLYHFFPGKPAILAALSERHDKAFQAIVEEISQVSDETWQSASTDQVVALLVRPLLDYVDRNPVYLSLARIDRKAGKLPADSPVHPLLQALGLRILSLRVPSASEQSKKIYAATLLGLPLGLVTELMAEYDPDMRAAVLHQEIPRAMTAYLQAVEVDALSIKTQSTA